LAFASNGFINRIAKSALSPSVIFVISCPPFPHFYPVSFKLFYLLPVLLGREEDSIHQPASTYQYIMRHSFDRLVIIAIAFLTIYVISYVVGLYKKGKHKRK
jgi:hypothetical protein